MDYKIFFNDTFLADLEHLVKCIALHGLSQRIKDVTFLVLTPRPSRLFGGSNPIQTT